MTEAGTEPPEETVRSSRRARIVVIGGGVSGLTITYELQERIRSQNLPAEVVCLEAESVPGGNIRTEKSDEFVTEWGPNGFLDNVPATLELVRRLGIEGRLLPASTAAHHRFLFRGGKLRKLPTGPLSFLTSDVLSVRGRLRVFCEPFGSPPPPDEDESVFSFAKRRIGEEAARVLVGAMVTGVYAGNAQNLSLQATFPKMYRMEREHGSLTRALFARRRAAKQEGKHAGGPAGPGGKLTSFRTGLDELTRSLAAAIGSSLRTNTSASRLEILGDGGYRIHLGAEDRPLEAEAVVLSCPSWTAAEIVREADRELSWILGRVPPAPVSVVHLGYRISDLPRPADGFGFLVPRGEGPRILGTIWASSIFDGRAPAGRVLLTTMIGGAHDPEAIDLDDGVLVEIVRHDLKTAMKIEAAPVFERIFRHPRGIPQYTLGHPSRLEEAERRLSKLPGVALAGNSYRGISVNSCVEEAPRVAERVLAHLGPAHASS